MEPNVGDEASASGAGKAWRLMEAEGEVASGKGHWF